MERTQLNFATAISTVRILIDIYLQCNTPIHNEIKRPRLVAYVIECVNVG